MPGGFEDDVTARAAMAARDLTHREEMKEGKRGMRDGETACSSHVGSREERDPRRRRWASHGGARGDSRSWSIAAAGTWSSHHRHVQHLFYPNPHHEMIANTPGPHGV